MNATSPLLEVDDLRATFTTPRGPLRAVDGISLQLDRGQTLGIVGESGSGKSVLVRSLMGLLPRSARTSGRVVLDGRDLATLSRRAQGHVWGPEIAMVFQNPMTSLNPVRVIGRQLTDPIRRHLGLSRRAARERAEELLRLVRIPEPERRLGQFPHELSGGMRQRVMIAIALSCSPKLLIADEPTTALDVTVQRQVLDLLSALQQRLGMAMILITHDLGVVAGRTERTAVMYGGRIVEEAPTSELFAAPHHRYTDALLRAIPRMDGPRGEPLRTIAGRPPIMVGERVGCSFAPRCDAAIGRCRSEVPILDGNGTHRAACFSPVGAPTLVGAEG